MKQVLKIAFCSALLMVGLCGCEKSDVDLDRLQGTWSKVYPEGVVAEGGVNWTFGSDNTFLIHIYDVSAGDYDGEYVYAVDDDSRTLTVWEGMFGGTSSKALYKIEKCSKETLELTLQEKYIREGTQDWFEGDVTFKRVKQIPLLLASK